MGQECSLKQARRTGETELQRRRIPGAGRGARREQGINSRLLQVKERVSGGNEGERESE